MDSNIDLDYLIGKLPSLKKVLYSGTLDRVRQNTLKIIFNSYKNALNADKTVLRKTLRAKRDKIKYGIIKKRSQSLINKIYGSKAYKNAQTVFCYLSFGSEIDTYPLIENALKNKRLCVPAVRDKTMLPVLIKSLNGLKKNKYGILEPLTGDVISKEEIDIAVVPGIAFNALGYRLGYGGGYYDRFLKDFDGYSIGMVFKEFITDEIIPESHDMPVDELFIQ